jgi:hypothetical protein
VVTGLITPIALADVVMHLLALRAEIWQNNLVEVALGAPPISGGRDVAWVIALRKALMTIVTPKNGCTCVATVGASH